MSKKSSLFDDVFSSSERRTPKGLFDDDSDDGKASSSRPQNMEKPKASSLFDDLDDDTLVTPSSPVVKAAAPIPTARKSGPLFDDSPDLKGADSSLFGKTPDDKKSIFASEVARSDKGPKLTKSSLFDDDDDNDDDDETTEVTMEYRDEVKQRRETAPEESPPLPPATKTYRGTSGFQLDGGKFVTTDRDGNAVVFGEEERRKLELSLNLPGEGPSGGRGGRDSFDEQPTPVVGMSREVSAFATSPRPELESVSEDRPRKMTGDESPELRPVQQRYRGTSGFQLDGGSFVVSGPGQSYILGEKQRESLFDPFEGQETPVKGTKVEVPDVPDRNVERQRPIREERYSEVVSEADHGMPGEVLDANGDPIQSGTIAKSSLFDDDDDDDETTEVTMEYRDEVKQRRETAPEESPPLPPATKTYRGTSGFQLDGGKFVTTDRDGNAVVFGEEERRKLELSLNLPGEGPSGGRGGRDSFDEQPTPVVGMSREVSAFATSPRPELESVSEDRPRKMTGDESPELRPVQQRYRGTSGFQLDGGSFVVSGPGQSYILGEKQRELLHDPFEGQSTPIRGSPEAAPPSTDANILPSVSELASNRERVESDAVLDTECPESAGKSSTAPAELVPSSGGDTTLEVTGTDSISVAFGYATRAYKGSKWSGAIVFNIGCAEGTRVVVINVKNGAVTIHKEVPAGAKVLCQLSLLESTILSILAGELEAAGALMMGMINVDKLDSVMLFAHAFNFDRAEYTKYKDEVLGKQGTPESGKESVSSFGDDDVWKAFCFAPRAYQGSDWDGDIVFNVQYDDGEVRVIVIRVKSQNVSVCEGLPKDASIICQLSLAKQTIISILRGEMQSAMAMMMGLINVDNLEQVMKFASAFKFEKDQFEAYLNSTGGSPVSENPARAKDIVMDAFQFAPHAYTGSDWDGDIVFNLGKEGGGVRVVVLRVKAGAVQVVDNLPSDLVAILQLSMQESTVLSILDGSMEASVALMMGLINVDKLDEVVKFSKAFKFDKEKFAEFLDKKQTSMEEASKQTSENVAVASDQFEEPLLTNRSERLSDADMRAAGFEVCAIDDKLWSALLYFPLAYLGCSWEGDVLLEVELPPDEVQAVLEGSSRQSVVHATIRVTAGSVVVMKGANQDKKPLCRVSMSRRVILEVLGGRKNLCLALMFGEARTDDMAAAVGFGVSFQFDRNEYADFQAALEGNNRVGIAPPNMSDDEGASCLSAENDDRFSAGFLFLLKEWKGSSLRGDCCFSVLNDPHPDIVLRVTPNEVEITQGDESADWTQYFFKVTCPKNMIVQYLSGQVSADDMVSWGYVFGSSHFLVFNDFFNLDSSKFEQFLRKFRIDKQREAHEQAKAKPKIEGVELAFEYYPKCFVDSGISGNVQYKILSEGGVETLKTVEILRDESGARCEISDGWFLAQQLVSATVTISEKDFLDIIEGSATAMTAFMTGRVTVDNPQKLMEVGKSFKFDRQAYKAFRRSRGFDSPASSAASPSMNAASPSASAASPKSNPTSSSPKVVPAPPSSGHTKPSCPQSPAMKPASVASAPQPAQTESVVKPESSALSDPVPDPRNLSSVSETKGPLEPALAPAADRKMSVKDRISMFQGTASQDAKTVLKFDMDKDNPFGSVGSRPAATSTSADGSEGGLFGDVLPSVTAKVEQEKKANIFDSTI